MDKKYLQSVIPFAASVNFKVDNASGTLFGSYKGFNVMLFPLFNLRSFQLSVAVKRQGVSPSLPEMQQIAAMSKKFLGACAVNGYRVDFNVKPSGLSIKSTVNNNLLHALEAVAVNLSKLGYENCCQVCGQTENVGTYFAYNCTARLCDSCHQTYVERNDAVRQEKSKKTENIVGGIIGALLGSLIGAAAIIIISQLGYIAAISGVIMGVCALKGYELLGGKLSKAGIIISSLIMVIMVFLSNQLDWAIILHNEYPSYGIFDAFKMMNYLLFNDGIELSAYLPQLFLLYIFTFVGAAPTVSTALRKQNMPDILYRMDESAPSQSNTGESVLNGNSINN